MKILFAPYAKSLRNGNKNAKDYGYNEELVKLLEEVGHEIIQIGAGDEPQIAKAFMKGLSFSQLLLVLQMSDTFIGVDSFLQHAAWYAGKKGIVLWSISDPIIYGHDLHINLLKDRVNVRPWPQQFDIYEGVAYNADLFVSPEEVMKTLQENWCK